MPTEADSSGRQLGGRLLRWHFASAEIAKQLDVDGLDWRSPGQLAGSELIKENIQRQVWRVSLGGKIYYVKIFKRGRNLWFLKRYLRGAPCLKEWRVAEYSWKAGVNCVRPVAYAVSTTPAGTLDCLLITEGLSNTVSLADYWPTLSPSSDGALVAEINRLEDAIAELLASAHHEGIAHCDLHPGNLLIEARDGQSKAYLVDLHSVRIGRRVSDEAAIGNLAQLNQWFRQKATVAQRMRLLKRYMLHRSELDRSRNGTWHASTFKHWARSLDDASGTHARRLWSSRDRRAMKSGKYFTRLRLGNGWHGHVFLKSKRNWPSSTLACLEFRREDWEKVLARPEELLESVLSQNRPIKHSRSALVCRGRIQVSGHTISVVCKRQIRRKRMAAIWDCLRYSRCVRAWRMAFTMLHRSVPVAQPVAALERRVGPYLADSLLITEEIKPSVNLRAFLTAVLPAFSDKRAREIKLALIDRLAELLRTMHQNGFAHRDMKATNILVQGVSLEERESFPVDQMKLVLVDLDGVRLKRTLTEKDQLRPLARLSLSADLSPLVTLADRARFLKSYLTRYGSGVPDWKLLWQQIVTERESRFQDHIAG